MKSKGMSSILTLSVLSVDLDIVDTFLWLECPHNCIPCCPWLLLPVGLLPCLTFRLAAQMLVFSNVPSLSKALPTGVSSTGRVLTILQWMSPKSSSSAFFTPTRNTSPLPACSTPPCSSHGHSKLSKSSLSLSSASFYPCEWYHLLSKGNKARNLCVVLHSSLFSTQCIQQA